MHQEMETKLGLTERETQIVNRILLDLHPQLVREWTLVGGLPLRFWAARAGKVWQEPFNDLDLISAAEQVLKSAVTGNFIVRHHHSNPQGFYFQLAHKQFPQVTIDIFPDHLDEETQIASLFGLDMQIPIPEEMYLFTLRDILLLLDRSRGLPPKHIIKMRLLEELVDSRKVSLIWERRHKNLPAQESKIYEYPSFGELKEAVEDALKKKVNNIKPWIKSDPLAPCVECVSDPSFPLYREQINQH